MTFVKIWDKSKCYYLCDSLQKMLWCIQISCGQTGGIKHLLHLHSWITTFTKRVYALPTCLAELIKSLVNISSHSSNITCGLHDRQNVWGYVGAVCPWREWAMQFWNKLSQTWCLLMLKKPVVNSDYVDMYIVLGKAVFSATDVICNRTQAMKTN